MKREVNVAADNSKITIDFNSVQMITSVRAKVEAQGVIGPSIRKVTVLRFYGGMELTVTDDYAELRDWWVQG